MVVKRRFGRIHFAIESTAYTKNEVFTENEEVFIYGFKHFETDKVYNFILIVCKSDELYENVKLFNIWSIKSIKKEIDMRIFEITGWFFMKIVRRNNKLVKNPEHMFVVEYNNLIKILTTNVLYVLWKT